MLHQSLLRFFGTTKVVYSHENQLKLLTSDKVAADGSAVFIDILLVIPGTAFRYTACAACCAVELEGSWNWNWFCAHCLQSHNIARILE